MPRPKLKSRYDGRHESPYMYIDGKKNKEPSLLDHVVSSLGDDLVDMIHLSLGLCTYEETATSSSGGEDSRNDVIYEAHARYGKSRRPLEKTNETRVDPEGDESQQKLRMIYEKQQQEKKKNGDSTNDLEDDDDLNLDDLSLGTPRSHEAGSYRSSSPTSCLKLKPASALKKSLKKSKKKLFHHKPLKKSVSFEESVEKELQGKWLDQAVGEIAADLNPYLTEMRKVYVKEMDGHDVVTEE
mmetsp:Transcript_20738/g.34181  ORF Transcript_20738/g.34181 Transcript_20738/m.34181 type:complete len:241 (+) Transcript_20738:189-911(+)